MDISGPNLKKLLSGVNFPSSKFKKTYSEKKKVKYFGKWRFLAPSLKNSYFRRELAKPEKQIYIS